MPTILLILVALPFVTIVLWRHRACCVRPEKKEPGQKRRELVSVPLSISQVCGFLLFLGIFALAECFTLPARRWASAFDMERLPFFANAFFTYFLPFGVAAFAIVSLLTTSCISAQKRHVSADRAMVLALLYAGVLGWQLCFAVDHFAGASVRVITPDGTASTGPAFEGKLAVFAIIAIAAVAILNLLGLGKWKDALGWSLIALAVGFVVALEV